MNLFVIVSFVMTISLAPMCVVLTIMCRTLLLRVEALERATEIHHGTLSEHWKEFSGYDERLKKLEQRRF